MRGAIGEKLPEGRQIAFHAREVRAQDAKLGRKPASWKRPLRAFEAGALDHLLKPFEDARFERALARAKDKIARYAPAPRWYMQRPIVKSPGQLLFVNVPDIDWNEASSYYACLHVERDTHVIRRTLAELKQDLGAEKVVRIYRSTIVNLERIRGLELQSSGEYGVLLGSGVRLRLSRRYTKPLQGRLAGMAIA